MNEKDSLRGPMRQARRDHVAALDQATRALLFLRPPAAVAEMVPADAIVGLYHALPHEAPTRGYARWLLENGRTIALPWFASRTAPMRFRRWSDPFADSDLEGGPIGFPQPMADAEEVAPQTLFVPMLAFTAAGARLGQGGGHYDRWLEQNPAALPIGMAWDCQLAEALPTEPHDRAMHAVVTPTRLYHGAE